jgi:polygalacturonase
MPSMRLNNIRAGAAFLLAATAALLWVVPAMATPALPVINTNNVVVITSAPYNAVGDGVTTNTTAIQSAITKAAAGGTTNGAAGGTVEIPAGIFLSGPFSLASRVNLQLDSGAILRMLSFTNYPKTYATNVVITYMTNSMTMVITTNHTTNVTFTAANFISASSLTDVEISGSGAIDGQGAPWWPYSTVSGDTRAIMISPSDCNRLLIQNVTLSNSPMFHIAIGGSHSGNSTVQNVTIFAPGSSPNTDACDVDGTNILVQNCNISEGDDDFTCGGGTSGVLLTNNTYGTGHGISIGSYTDSGGVSNITVINCTMNGAVNGIRIKSDNDRGGLVQNISYYNVSMTNVDFPVQIYAYYEEVGTPSSISPYYASTQAVASVSGGLTPAFRNITFSNITATSVSGFPVGIIWARTEMPATNIVFNKFNVTGDRNFCLYNVNGARFIDCNIKVSPTSNTFALFNAQFTITNSAPTNTLFTFNGLTTNVVTSGGVVTNVPGNSFAFYNAQASLKNTNAIADNATLALSASTFIVSNNLTLFPTNVLDFTLGTNAATVAVVGNLTLGGTNTISAGGGFTNGTYTLMTYTGTLGGSPPVLGSLPAGYNYAFDTSTAGQVNLIVTLLAPTNLVATGSNLVINLEWNSVSGAAGYNLKRGTVSGTYPTIYSGLTATNYADANVTNAVNYFYVVSASGAGGESSNSLPATAAPLPSNQPTNLVMEAGGGQLQLSWPQDHLGWRLQIQTNDLSAGIGTNWATVANSANVNQTNIVINPANGTVFLRLVYP